MNQGLNSLYFDVTKKAEINLSKVKDYQKKVSLGELGISDFNKKVLDLEYAKSAQINEVKKVIDRLNKILPEVEGERQGAIEDEIIRLKEGVLEMGD
jgi:hypothetical protein